MDLHYSQTYCSCFFSSCLISLPYGFTLFSNGQYAGFVSLDISLPYGFTLFSNGESDCLCGWIISLPYGFTLFSNIFKPRRKISLISLPYGFTLFSNCPCLKRRRLVISLPYGFTLFSNYNATILTRIGDFTTLWIYTILKRSYYSTALSVYFTTLWIYTILKPQISCAHYTAQGKSTRSSTIVLWRNGIVKGAQIPIQHIEFGAHIYARRCLAL